MLPSEVDGYGADFDPKAVWNAIDGMVFEKLWPDRPWKPLPGGASHLARRPSMTPGRLANNNPFLQEQRSVSPQSPSHPTGSAPADGSFRRGSPQQQLRPPRSGSSAAALPPSQYEWTTSSRLTIAFNAPGGVCAIKIQIQGSDGSLSAASSSSSGGWWPLGPSRASMCLNLVKTVGGGGGFSADLQRVRDDLLVDGEACYVVFSSGGTGAWVLFSFVPDATSSHERALYAEGEAQLVSSLGGQERIPWREHWSAKSDLDALTATLPASPEGDKDRAGGGMSGLGGRPPKGLGMAAYYGVVDDDEEAGGGGGRDYEDPDDKFERMWANRGALTDIERMRLEGEYEARARATHSKANPRGRAANANAPGASVRGASKAEAPAGAMQLKFPLTSEASEALQAFRVGASGGVVLAIEGEELVLRGKVGPSTRAAGIRGAVANEPCYVLWRWEHEREGRPVTSTLLVYIRPEGAPLRAKMIHASSMRPLVESVRALGVEVSKSIDGLEPEELSEGELAKQLYVYE